MSSIGTSRPCSANASRAADTTRCRLRSASTRSPPPVERGEGGEVIRHTLEEVEAAVHLSATLAAKVETGLHLVRGGSYARDRHCRAGRQAGGRRGAHPTTGQR